ncbi:hypothetical protein QJS10_CPA16g01196 [Acorus calamus]|uniref:DNA topoisomerase 2 n=1 Tax=Acorus calamus TaxID=4465 RepID=A0AAV9D1K4_ACOCL|nr:hypothetical protein QJS10_CPA16g01196 [Acorus calamus]
MTRAGSLCVTALDQKLLMPYNHYNEYYVSALCCETLLGVAGRACWPTVFTDVRPPPKKGGFNLTAATERTERLKGYCEGVVEEWKSGSSRFKRPSPECLAYSEVLRGEKVEYSRILFEMQALEVTVWRDGKEFKQNYSRGKPVTTLTSQPLPSGTNTHQGTCIRFWPDKEVFTTTINFDHNTISGRIRELAFLNPELTITLRKEDSDPKKTQYNEYYYAGGLVEYVNWLNTDKKPLHDTLAFRKETDGITVDVALQWSSDAYTDTMLGYANSIRTIDGGTHIDGMKEKDISLSGEHVREGLTCIVSVKVPNPEFEGQTKTRLGNPEVRRVVEHAVQEHLTEYLELHPDALESILSKSLNALKAALAAKRARELVRTKSVLKSSTLPGKLADCSCTNPEESEIFIVEGDSAGGSAKQGRDRRFQAILPLRGKILNIERRDEAAMYKNEEIQNLILGLGLGVKGEDFKKEALRYHKIIILTDADVDGAHIRTLLLTFFFRYQKALFDEGCIYVGVPPLYKAAEATAWLKMPPKQMSSSPH